MKLPKHSVKWIVVGLLIVAAFILHLIPKSMEVTLQVRADYIDFKLPGKETEIDLLNSLPLAALHVNRMASLSLPVVAVSEQGRALVSSPQRITLRAAEGRPLRLTFRGEAFRLMRLSFASETQVVLSPDRQNQVIMQVDNPGRSQMQLGVLGAQ